MIILELMYVYFDKKGNIKTISNTEQHLDENIYSYAMFPQADVSPFLLGKRNPFDFCVKISNGIFGKEYKIERKRPLDVNLVRILDNFLTEIKKLPKSSDASILIINRVLDKKIQIEINSMINEILDDGTDDQQDSIRAIISQSMALYFTTKNDPHRLIYTITFSLKDLFEEGKLYFEYDVDLSNTSVYTRKIIDNCSYMIK